MTDSNGQFSVDTMADMSWDLKVGDLTDIECRNAHGDMLEESFQVN